MEISSVDVTNSQNRLYAATFSNTLYWLIFCIFKKALYLTENLLSFNGTSMDRRQPFESFLKMDALSS